MQRIMKKMFVLVLVLLTATLYFNVKIYAVENNKYTVKVAIVKVPDSWDEVDNLNLSGFILEVQLPDGDTDVYDCSKINFVIDDSNPAKTVFNSDKLCAWLYKDDTINFIFKEYGDITANFVKNDFRYYNFKNNSQTYTFTTDYEISKQTLFDVNKEYPSQYDLRDKINIKVENQGGFGLCWDFALTKALETTYAMKYGKEIDLSEMYIDYMTNNKNGRGDRTLHSGGNHYLYYNETIRSGICSEEQLPFNDKEEYNMNDVKKCKSEALPQGAFLVDENQISLNRNKKIVNKMIKEQLMNNGAVTVSITFSQVNYNDKDYTFFLPTYCIQDNYASHEVTIIGWEDNFSKDKFKRNAYISYGVEEEVEPKEDGAWIVLNSWGSEYGNNGVFYLSYESDIKNAFGFLDVIPYEERYEYSYVNNEYKNIIAVSLNNNQKKYFYEEYNVNGDNRNITHITIANVVRGKVYYIDNYNERDEINFDDKIFIGDFASSISPVKFNFLDWMFGDYPLKTNFALDEPIKVNGDKFLIIVELDGDYVTKAFLNKSSTKKTYYTDDDLSLNWNMCEGNLPIGIFTIDRLGMIESEIAEGNSPTSVTTATVENMNVEEITQKETTSKYPKTGDNCALWISLLTISFLELLVIKKHKNGWNKVDSDC